MGVFLDGDGSGQPLDLRTRARAFAAPLHDTCGYGRLLCQMRSSQEISSPSEYTCDWAKRQAFELCQAGLCRPIALHVEIRSGVFANYYIRTELGDMVAEEIERKETGVD